MNHRVASLSPASCGSLQAKIENLQRQINSIDDRIDQRETLIRNLDFANRGIVISGVIMDSCIAFLDLASAAFASLNGPAARAAGLGSSAVKASHSLSQAVSGQTTWSRATSDLISQASTAAATLTPDRYRFVATSTDHFVQTSTGLANLAMSSRSSEPGARAQTRADGTALITQQFSGKLNLFRDAAEAIARESTDAGTKRLHRGLSALASVEAARQAIIAYDRALTGRFDEFLREERRTELMRQGLWEMRRRVAAMKRQLNLALAEFRGACL